jgi:hypothetical protein
MSAFLIVDGHNLLRSGAIPLAGDPGDASGRDELCALLSAYARRKGFRLTVAFDGRGSGKADRSRVSFKGGTAVYSGPSETADDVIRELARTAPAGSVVVTSDRGLTGTLSSRRVGVVDCGEFASRLFEEWIDGVKGGGGEDDAPAAPGPGRKKGEGHRKKKRDRERDRLLRKL